ncbi:hypothetical protein FRB91_010048 [Serendipita sp. 411]|nr:hypothetical protein FRC18_010233 [Serendipita sp. 400]KAG8858296.1 hypothetical protein FRB91_010048 [Serendipita sp. 411]
MALYQLPKATLTSLRLNIKDGPGHHLNSMIPSVVDTFLTRLTDPSPAHHALRAPFIRPLLNTNASNQPLFNILSPVYEPKAEHMEPESPIQARLIEFFEEKKGTLLMNTVIEEDLPVFVYCIHRKRMLGAPQLVINETYNSTLNKASKVTAIPHLLSVISHQFSLMLQAQADPNFKVTTSRRPSDLDRSSEFLAMKRASFADFQIEKRGGKWQIAGCLQPDQTALDHSAPSCLVHKETGKEIPFYQPRAMDQSKILSWYAHWTKSNWSSLATLDFFTPENTVPWESIEDNFEKTIGTGEKTRVVKIKPRKSRRETSFAPALSPWELTGGNSRGDGLNREKVPIQTEEELGAWETGEAAVHRDRRRSNWIDRLSANDLGEPEGRSAQKVRYTPQEYAPQGIRKRLTGSNNAPLGSNTRWGSSPTTPSKSGEFQTRSSSPTDSNRASSSLKAKSPSKRFTRESAPHPGR